MTRYREDTADDTTISYLSHRSDLHEQYLQKATQELNEIPELVPEKINQLKKLLSDEQRLYYSDKTEHLLRFLRAKKFDVNRTFNSIKRYYQVRKDRPQLFGNLTASRYIKFIEANIQIVLEQRDSSGSRVYLFRLQNCDMNLITVDDIFRINLMVMELISAEPETQISGVVIVVDMKSFSMQQHYTLLSPCYVKYSVDAVQESFPVRFKAFHVINEPFYFQTLYATMKPFMKPKMRKRIFFHGSKISSLHKYINREILPQEYGGLQPDNSKYWTKRLLSYEHKLKELSSYGYDKKPESETLNQS